MKVVHSNLKHKLLLFLITLLMIPLFYMTRSAITVFTQTKNQNERQVKKRSWKNEPIEIVGLKNNQRPIDVGESFLQSTNWLEGFTLRYKNNSGKNIIWLNVALDFPETKATGNLMSFPLSTGINPLRSPINQPIQPIRPGESVELMLTPKHYERLKAFIEKRQPLDSLTEVALRIDFILFDDGTGWSAGSMVRRDPNNPRRWVPIDTNK